MKYRIITNTESSKITAKNLKLLAEYSDGVYSDAEASAANEIVLGDTKRSITDSAKALLRESLCDEVGYAVIAEGGSIAAAWSDFRLEEAAIKHIAENIKNIKDGYSFADSFALMPYLKERGEAIKEAAWEKFRAYLGEESGDAVISEFKKLYSLFDERNVRWLANLYDPERGAWYHSNSARDTYGYLPTIEESYGVLCFFSLSGMAEMVNGSSTNILSPKMKEKLAEFVFSKQDEDTYFYHPQWPKEFIIDNNYQSRITRDKGSALWILSSLGKEPKYKDLPKKETEKKSDAPRVLAQFESVENFRQYLDGLEKEYLALDTPEKRAYQFYAYGNLFQSTTGYINANPEFKRMLLEFFEKYQNKETGTWSEIVCFNAVNGLHKIASVYNSIGARLNYIDEAVDTTMKQLCVGVEEKPAYSFIDVYNIWSVFPYLYKNITSFGEGSEQDRLQKKEEIKRRIFAAAPKAIKTGYGQVVGLRCENSAFSTRGGTLPFHMGCPITLPGLHEGTTVSLYSLTHHIFMALEAEEYEVPYCTEYERMIFMEEINKVIGNGPAKKEKAPYRVITNKPDDKRTLALIDRLREVVNITGVYTDEEPRQVLEIVLGETSRDISKSAKERLDTALANAGEDTAGFSIHSLGSIGIVCSDEAALDAAIEHFVKYFPSVNTVKTFPLLPYLKERGEKIKEEKWQELKDALAKECGEECAEPIVRELRELQSMFTTSNAEWMARLYDPKVGGWYWSNSARDNEGFLPDIEDTYTALSFIGSSGMSEMYGGDWTKAIPEWLKKKVGNYIYNLQDEDGLFYNLQWPKEYIIANNRQPRVTRDVGSAKFVLKKLGITPKYPDAPKPKNDDAPRMLTQFDSVENFKEYMKKIEDEILAIENPNDRAARFYFYGNTFQSVTSYLNANEEMKKIFIDFLERYQSKETGMWSDIACYHATNGLHKIADVANMIGYKLKYIDEMVDTVMNVISLSVEECPAAGGVYIYNAWSCLPYIYKNILDLGDGSEEERIARKEAIKKRVLENAPALIRNAKRQLEGFAREDGSFSYNRQGSTSIAQGCPIAVPNSCEGDMNGNVIAVNAIRRHILMALEVGEYMVPIFTEYERVIFMNIIEKLDASVNQ